MTLIADYNFTGKKLNHSSEGKQIKGEGKLKEGMRILTRTKDKKIKVNSVSLM